MRWVARSPWAQGTRGGGGCAFKAESCKSPRGSVGAPSAEGLTAGCRWPEGGGSGQASLALTLKFSSPETPVCRWGEPAGDLAVLRPAPRSSPRSTPHWSHQQRRRENGRRLPFLVPFRKEMKRLGLVPWPLFSRKVFP